MTGFAPYSAFCRVDRNAQECIDSFAISKFLQDNGANGRIGDCAKLVRFFDSDEDGILSYNDFIQMLLPCDDNILRAEVQRRPYSRVGRFDALPIDMEMALVRVIQHEIDLISRVESMIRDIERQPDYSVYAAFRTVDKYNEGKINFANLQDFIRSFGVYLVDTELFAAIRRIDTDGDAKISFEEFSDFFKNQVNQEAPMLQAREMPAKKPASNGYKKKSQSAAKATPHRAHDFATDSKQGANIEKMINTMTWRQRAAAAMVSPVQRNPIRGAHETSPLRASKIKHVSFASASGGGSRRSAMPTMPSSGAMASRRFGSPIKQETEIGVVSMLDEQANLDKEVERAKENMASQPDFNVYDAFRMFDIDGRGSVNATDVRYGLADIGVHVEQEDARLFVERYDKDGDGRLDFREFQQAMTPTDPYYASMLMRRPSSHMPIDVYRKDSIFAAPTASTFKSAMRTFMNTESTAENTRQNLSRNPYFDPTEAFVQCDLSNNGRVSKDEIRYLLESKGKRVTDTDAAAIAKRLDFNNDGTVTHTDFVNSLRPKSPPRRRM